MSIQDVENKGFVDINVGCVVEFRVHGRLAWHGDVFAAILNRPRARADHQSPGRTRESNFTVLVREFHVIVSRVSVVVSDAHTFSNPEHNVISQFKHDRRCAKT